MIYGIVLAAGLGHRVGTPKALLRLAGRSFLERAVGSFKDAGLDALVVLNAQVDAAIPVSREGERRLLNRDPDDESGMFGSVRLGVSEASRLGSTGVVLLPVDHPCVTAEDISRVAAQLRDGTAIAVATHQGRRGHPVGVNRQVMEEILSDPSVRTLRDLVRRDRERVVDVPGSSGVVTGVNTREDLEQVLNRTFR